MLLKRADASWSLLDTSRFHPIEGRDLTTENNFVDCRKVMTSMIGRDCGSC